MISRPGHGFGQNDPSRRLDRRPARPSAQAGIAAGPAADGPGELGGELGLEAGPGEEGIGSGPASLWVGDPGQGRRPTGQEPGSRLRVGRAGSARGGAPARRRRQVGPGAGSVADGDPGRLGLPFGEDGLDDGLVDTPVAELTAEGDGPPRTGAVARGDPGAGEGDIVEVSGLEEAADGGLDELLGEAGSDEAPPDLADRTRASFEVTGGGVEDRPDVGDGGPLGPAISARATGRPTRPPRSLRPAAGSRSSGLGSGLRSPRRRPDSSGGTPSPPHGPDRGGSRRR